MPGQLGYDMTTKGPTRLGCSQSKNPEQSSSDEKLNTNFTTIMKFLG
jgi:hypothetical protein